MKLLREVLAWACFVAVVGLLSVWPRYDTIEADHAVVTVTFSHAAKRIGECRTLTQEDLNKLPPNMRKPSECPRERHPVRIELRSGDSVLYAEVLAPSGIWSDGKSNIYRRVIVPARTHDLFVGMNDSGGEQGFDFEKSKRIKILPGRNLVVRFDEQLHQFSIQ
ncbi:MAG: hypothetical protein OEQ90_08005 [Gammaproteobacteria bacterium]|nr:hypothetical protein [Gammaproteobacteria bacterium]